MKLRTMILGGLFLALLAASLSAQEKSYATPQEVFEAARAANKKNDLTAFTHCLTPESQQTLAGVFAFSGLQMKAAADADATGKLKEKLKPILDVLKKHGLTDDALKGFKPTRDPDEVEKTSRPLVKLIAKPVDFFLEFFTVMEKNVLAKPFRPFENTTLSDVKVDGEKAKAMLVTKFAGKDQKEPIEFVKKAGGWKILIPEEKPEKPAPKEKANK